VSKYLNIISGVLKVFTLLYSRFVIKRSVEAKQAEKVSEQYKDAEKINSKPYNGKRGVIERMRARKK
jgi:hypothetical protein